MGSFFSKLNCNCEHDTKVCQSNIHRCICYKLKRCRYGIKKFGRCIEKSKECLDDNRELIFCLAKKHDKLPRSLLPKPIPEP